MNIDLDLISKINLYNCKVVKDIFPQVTAKNDPIFFDGTPKDEKQEWSNDMFLDNKEIA